MASFISSSCLDTGAELPRWLVFGFSVWESVCANTLVVIATESAIASRRFIFSPESNSWAEREVVQQSGAAADSEYTSTIVLINDSEIVSWRSYRLVNGQ